MTRTLHVAAMPFPSHQGTQAAVRAMLDSLSGAGRETHLLTYPHGAFPLEASFEVHRIADRPRVRSLRSGPSAGKLALDAQLAARLPRIAQRLAPQAVVAHHVEAATAALAARARPLVFFAHTALGPELPGYGPRLLAPLAKQAGLSLDGWLCRRADAVAALAPALQQMLSEHGEHEVRYVPLPWPVPEPASGDERARGRARAGLGPDDRAVLYAGNLDAYQGWELIVRALASLPARHPGLRLLVATASDPAPLLSLARRAGVADRIRTTALGGEPARRELHAAADVAVVPRRAPGGLPIKLLEALARGVPTVTTPRATAGLDLRGAALVVADDDPEALAAGLDLALTARETSAQLGQLGRAYVATDHAPARFVGAFDETVERARRQARAAALWQKK